MGLGSWLQRQSTWVRHQAELQYLTQSAEVLQYSQLVSIELEQKAWPLLALVAALASAAQWLFLYVWLKRSLGGLQRMENHLRSSNSAPLRLRKSELLYSLAEAINTRLGPPPT